MSDVALAQSLVSDIGGSEVVKVKLRRAYARLTEMFPHEDEPERRWTWRRVRALWGREVAAPKYFEMVELAAAAERAIEERELLKNARKEHAEFIAKTARLRALLEHQDAAFHRPDIEGLGSITRGMDRAGTEE
ncbi:MAG: hypothetical protein KDJ90_00515 [Nitratireductor sp.]|nr:hypothetical protein [Nitratireductor sp.]